MEITESLGTKVLNSQLRTSYLASAQDEYELYIDTLMLLHKKFPDRGFDVQALAVSEQSRARSLLDSLLEDKKTLEDAAPPDLISRERQLLQALDEKAEYQMNLASRKHTQQEADELWKQERWRAPFYWAAFVFQGEYSNEVKHTSIVSFKRVGLISGISIILIATLYALIKWYRLE